MINAGREKPICVDLCCGGGGLAYGFELAGFDVALGIDIDVEALQTYKGNRSRTHLIAKDIRAADGRAMLNYLPKKKRKIDGVLAGPPCKGFSQSNRRSRTLNNPLNSLYLDVMRMITDLEPKWFLIENVWGLEQVAHGAVKDHIIKLGRTLGYDVSAKVLNAADYGVPQIRRRIFFVGIRGKGPFIFPAPTAPRYVTVRQAISDLPSLSNGDSRGVLPYRAWGNALTEYQLQMRRTKKRTLVTGNLVTRNNELVRKRYGFIPPGGNWENIPIHLMHNYKDQRQCHTGIYRRLKWESPSVVISNFRKNMLIHPVEDRGLSVREAARLQSFPDHYLFDGSLGSQQQQVADAVPPLLSYELARAILQTMY